MAWLLSKYDPRNDAINTKLDDEWGHDDSSDSIFDLIHARKKNTSGYMNFLCAYNTFRAAEKLQPALPVAEETKSSVLLTEILSNSLPWSPPSTAVAMLTAAVATTATTTNQPVRQRSLPSTHSCSGTQQVHPNSVRVSTSSIKSSIQSRSAKNGSDNAALIAPITPQTSLRTQSAPPNKPTDFRTARVLLSESQQPESSVSTLSPSMFTSPPPPPRQQASPRVLPPSKFTFRVNATGMKYQRDPGPSLLSFCHICHSESKNVVLVTLLSAQVNPSTRTPSRAARTHRFLEADPCARSKQQI